MVAQRYVNVTGQTRSHVIQSTVSVCAKMVSLEMAVQKV